MHWIGRIVLALVAWAFLLFAALLTMVFNLPALACMRPTRACEMALAAQQPFAAFYVSLVWVGGWALVSLVADDRHMRWVWPCALALLAITTPLAFQKAIADWAASSLGLDLRLQAMRLMRDLVELAAIFGLVGFAAAITWVVFSPLSRPPQAGAET